MGVAAPSFSAPHLTKETRPGQSDTHEIRGCGHPHSHHADSSGVFGAGVGGEGCGKPHEGFAP